MSYITGFDRSQALLFPESIDQVIDKDNVARFIDAFVNSLDFPTLGFKDVNQNVNGRPPYHPKDLLKLLRLRSAQVYIYGYLNKIRASRKLETECKRNIELMLLMNGLAPDHNTISNFRRDNPKAIKQVFRLTVELAKNYDLIGGILLAGDGTKLRAQNSKKNTCAERSRSNYNQKKIDRHIAYIENRLSEYCEALETADGDKKKPLKRGSRNITNTKHGIKR